MGPVNIHVGMLVVPALCVAVAGGDRKYTIAAFVVMSATFAAQPDRGTAIGLLFAALIFALLRRNWISGLAVLISGIGLTVTMYRADQLAGVTFVEHVIEESIADGGLTWILILTSLLAAILSPVILIDKTKSDKLVATAVFSSFFFGLSLASVIGEYPTPLVGYGASPIIGYGLGIAMLSKQTKDTENG